MRPRIKVAYVGLAVLALLFVRVTDKDRQRSLSGQDVGPHRLLLQATPGLAASPAKSENSRPSPERLAIVRWGPRSTRVGEPFNVQPSGNSALWLGTTNASSTTKVIFGDTTLSTTFGGKRVLSATVPIEELQTAGEIELFLRDAATGRVSDSVRFLVEP